MASDDLRERAIEAVMAVWNDGLSEEQQADPSGGVVISAALAVGAVLPLVEEDTAERIAAWLERLGSHDNGGMPVLYDVVELAGGIRSGVWKG